MSPDEIMAAVPMPLVLIGHAERVEAMNPPAEALLGAGAVARHYIAVLRQPGVQDAVERVLRGGTSAEGAFHSAEAGRDVTWRVTVRPALGGALAAFEDVSQAAAEAEVRRDFVANVSHELRTPLTAMTGFIETLRGPARDDAAARERFLATMAKEAARMNRLVRDLLSLSRVESEARLRPRGTVDLPSVLAASAAALRPVAEEAGAEIELVRAGDPVSVPGDVDQLQQVFVNLVENALKYGGRKVRVALGRIESDPLLRVGGVRVEVTDDGIGIDPIHLPRLTERFYRVDSHRSREMGGTGLGLAICKHIVNRHRGRMRIDSEPGQGTRVTVVLPATAG